MKKRLLFAGIFTLLFPAFFVAGCKSDPTEGPDTGGDDKTPREAKEWIYNNLKDWYLWPDEVKAKSPDYGLEYEEFFESLLSKGKDGKSSFYSQIERTPSVLSTAWAPISPRSDVSGDLGFGLEFVIHDNFIFKKDEKGNAAYFAVFHVTYVVKGSPAAEAGIKRGDMITHVGGTQISGANYKSLYPKILPEELTGKVASAVKVTFGTPVYWGEVKDNNENKYPAYTFSNQKEITLTPKKVVDNPVFLRTVVPCGDKKVGYLVYNQFTDGVDSYSAGKWNNDHEYDDDLKEAFGYFEREGIDDLVLDLRYNNGGLTTCCQLLASMIVSKKGEVFLNEQFSSAKRNKDDVMKFLSTTEIDDGNFGKTQQAVCLDLPRLYVLVTASTASASEAIIVGLRNGSTITANPGDGGIPVYLIGKKTEGKNVGMIRISPYDNFVTGGTYNKYDYIMWPVAFTLTNRAGFGAYSAGFTPNYQIEETDYPIWSQLGEADEHLLSVALQHISTGSFPASVFKAHSPQARSTSMGGGSIDVVSSVDLRGNNFLIDPTVRVQ